MPDPFESGSLRLNLQMFRLARRRLLAARRLQDRASDAAWSQANQALVEDDLQLRRLKLENLLRDRPKVARWWHELGSVCAQLLDLEGASHAWKRATEVVGSDLALLHLIGRSAARAGISPDLLMPSGMSGLAEVPPNANTPHLTRPVILAILLDELANALSELENQYRIASPGDIERANLIYALQEIGKSSRAACLEASHLLAQGKAGQAVAKFEYADAEDRLSSAFATSFLEAVRQLGEPLALAASARLVTMQGTAEDRFACISTLIEDGELECAGELLDAINAFPLSREIHLASQFLNPAVPACHEATIAYRQRFDLAIKALEAFVDGASKPERQYLLTLLSHTFYFGYQCDHADQLLRCYGRAITRLIRSVTEPEVSLASASSPTGRRIRVGYVTGFACFHTVMRYFAGWLQHADHRDFEIHLFPLASDTDWMIEFLGQHVARVHPRATNLDLARRQISEQALDILVYPEVGMDPLALRLAALRLAAVQCAAWGHPLTTGFDSIDYFLSVDAMEPDDGHRHYAERLVLLPGIGACVPAARLDGPLLQRRDFGLDEGDVVFLTPQSLFKYQPQDDSVFPALTSRFDNAVLVFVEGAYPAWTRTFDLRLRASFAASGVAYDRRVRWVQRQDFDQFLSLLRVSDVFLDCLRWSGGMTTLDAIACGLPVVTLPGTTMRSRQSAAMLRQLGINDTIARDLDDYLDIATRLGQDPVWRGRLADTMAANQHCLFDDVSSVRALEAFFRWSLGGSNEGVPMPFNLGPART